jgi:serine/threonine protein kinase
MALLELLQQSRILSEDQLAQINRRFVDGDSVSSILSSLVAEGQVTPFQSRCLERGEIKNLELGQYRILDELGQGGFGAVYKAVHTIMGRVVAIKVISSEFVEDSRARTWFKREVVAATQLCHPNIVMAYDANEVDDILFLVMEYVEGLNLDLIIKREGPLPIPLVCEMMRQTALALQYAHEKGMVHRDIKPANLLIPAGAMLAVPEGSVPGCAGALPTEAAPVLVKIVDFGLARLRGHVNIETLMPQNEHNFLGTPDYVAPEQARDSHAADIRSDLYSLGCSFYYALTAQKPFHGGSLVEVLTRQLEHEPEPVTTLRPEVPPALAGIIRRLMAKDPAKRFQTPAQLAGQLACLCNSGTAGAIPSVGSLSRPEPREPAPISRPLASAEKTPVTTVIPGLAFSNGPASLYASEATHQGSHASAEALAVDPEPTAGLVPTDSSSREVRGAGAPVSEPLPSEETVCQSWQQWLTLVERCVRSRRPCVNKGAYQAAHRRLLDICRSHAQTGDGARSAFYGRVETIVEPWLTPQALAAVDRATVLSLLRNCRQIERELGIRRGIWSLRTGAALLAFLVFFVALGLCWWEWRRNRPVLVQRSSLSSLWWLMETHPLLGSLLVLPALVLVSIWLYPRLLRT